MYYGGVYIVSSTVKVQKGGYSVASEVKNTGGTVKAQKGGYSVASEKGTTKDEGKYETVKASEGSYSVAQEAGTTVANNQPDIVAGSGITSTAQTEHIVAAQEATKTTESTLSTTKQSQATPVPTKEELKSAIDKNSLLGVAINRSGPSDQVVAQEAVKSQSTKLNEYFGNKASSEDLLRDTTSNTTSTHSLELTNLYSEKDGVIVKAQNLGMAEPTAVKYEQFVSKVTTPLVNPSETVQKVSTILETATGGVISPVIGLKVVGGAAESILYTPTAIPRLFVSLVRNPVLTVEETIKGTVETVVADPARGVGQLAGMAIVGKVAGKANNVVKESIPLRLTSESTPQGFLLKKSDVVINPTKSIVQDVPLIETSETVRPMEYNVFAKANKEGTADVYVRLNAEQASRVSELYKGNVRNIKTDYGSFVEFEPTGEIVASEVSKSNSPRMETNTPLQIGYTETGSSLSKLKSPVRIEYRENLQPASLQAKNVPDRLQLPEITADMEANARVVQDPVMLRSGEIGFWESEAGSLLQKEKKATVINDMPWMKEKVVHVKSEVALAEPVKPLFDFKAEFEEIYNRPEASKTPSKVLEVNFKKNAGSSEVSSNIPLISRFQQASQVSEQSPVPSLSISPKLITEPSPNISPVSTPSIQPTPSPSRSASPFTSRSPGPSTSPYPTPQTSTPSLEYPSTTPPIPKSSIVSPGVPSVEIPDIRQSRRESRKPGPGNEDWQYGRTSNKYTNPFNVKFRGL